MSGVPRGKCFGPVIVLPVHLGDFSILENKVNGFAADTTLMAILPSAEVSRSCRVPDQ